MTSGISVLCVDDDPDVRALTTTALERTGEEFTVVTAGCGHDALSRLTERDRIDCVVSDYDMPGMDGLELLDAVRDRDPELPFILFTGKGSEEIASDAISAGVTDYLQKGSGIDQYTVLVNRIENAVDRYRTSRAQRRSERELERYRTLVESNTDPMYVLDSDGICTVANEAFCRLVETDREAVVGTHISDLISRDGLERGAKTVRQLRQGNSTSTRYEVSLGRNDNRWVGEANLAMVTDEDGNMTGSTAVIRDITDRKRRERELIQYEEIIQLAPISLFILGADATIERFNDEFADAFAEDAAELRGMRFPELVDRGYYDGHVIDKFNDQVRELLSSSSDLERAEYHVRFQAPEGEERIHDVHTKLLPLEDGSFAGTIHAIRDITKRRRYQRELEHQNDRLEEFAGVVSHDLRNPLNVAQGNLELHANECQVETDTKMGSVEQIRHSLDRMDDLIEELLSLARHGQRVGELEPVDLPRLVQESWNAVDTTGATLACSIDATISADEGRVRALLENLFRNAVEHGNAGSDLESERDEGHVDTDVTVTVGLLENDGSTSGFYVADDGSGFETDPEKLFEFGHTTTSDGTGLGLAIVDGIAAAHGWTASARESRGGGARFEISGVRVLE
ncbi:PAS domain S-box-containing protein [Natronorubrum sediminis]|uniref:histidine kinase n=1 Tax=Natronorubrum sediminis TaxID=640943 RepID=A0A1H6FPY7_9EURY|nr:PAS domain S-box protein [Natronorubrum sediminis]SEH12989.1 PAS domain S-box-containing protein [Natronorubrum sediminis]